MHVCVNIWRWVLINKGWLYEFQWVNNISQDEQAADVRNNVCKNNVYLLLWLVQDFLTFTGTSGIENQ